MEIMCCGEIMLCEPFKWLPVSYKGDQGESNSQPNKHSQEMYSVKEIYKDEQEFQELTLHLGKMRNVQSQLQFKEDKFMLY